MKRRLSFFAIGLSFMFILTSCKAGSDIQSSGPTDIPAESAPPASVSAEPDNADETPVAGFSAKDAVKIEEIDWSVEESLVDGERFISYKRRPLGRRYNRYSGRNSEYRQITGACGGHQSGYIPYDW